MNHVDDLAVEEQQQGDAIAVKAALCAPSPTIEKGTTLTCILPFHSFPFTGRGSIIKLLSPTGSHSSFAHNIAYFYS